MFLRNHGFENFMEMNNHPSRILYIWAIGVLAAGQSSTITGTYAEQFIMGGFLNLRLKKWLRALITRSCAIIPTLVVALIFGTSEDSLDVLNEWLNVLQSIQIPFALIPLLCLVSKEEVMGFFKIGPVLQVISWLVAALVMVINGYVLVNFFSSYFISLREAFPFPIGSENAIQLCTEEWATGNPHQTAKMEVLQLT